MKIEQIYTGCLAQGAYYISSDGEAAIIDPLRDYQPYVDTLEKDKVKLKYIFETHFHADFVSGHIDLGKATGAKIVYGPNAQTSYEAEVARDGQVFSIGKVQLKVLHTPGHTMESSSFLLMDETGKEHALFTGDTLFIGDVGRPDLAQKVAGGITQEDLASLLFDSLRTKIMTLPDDVTVYPGHGAGSACGKKMSKETVSTIGKQKNENYALRVNMTKEEFIKEVTDGLLPPPAYFGQNVDMNKNGYLSIDSAHEQVQYLDPAQFETAINGLKGVVLDSRSAGEFSKKHIPNSINIGLKGSFAPWVGDIVKDVTTPLYIIADEGTEEELLDRLSRVGFDHVIAFLKGGIDSWVNANKEVDSINRITADALAQKIEGLPAGKNALFVDVRKASEYEAEHVDEAFSKPLAAINEWFSDIDDNEHFYLYCGGGYRSMIAASILQSRGIRNFTEIEGGFGAIAQTNVPKTNFVCPSKVHA